MLTCTGTGQWSNNIIPSCIAIVNPSSSGTSSRLSATSTTYTMTGSTQRSSSTGTASITQRSLSITTSLSNTIDLTIGITKSTQSISNSTVTPISNIESTAFGIGVGLGATILFLVLVIILILLAFIIKLKRGRSAKHNLYVIPNEGVLATELNLIPSQVPNQSTDTFNLTMNESYTDSSGNFSAFKMSNNESYLKETRLPYYAPGSNRVEINAQLRKSKSELITLDCLRLTNAIGSGQFGNVCKGQWKKPNGDTIDVAVKMLQDGASEQEKIKFLQEAAIMSQFNHSNVIKLHGVVHDETSPMIVIEYMPKGDLDHFLLVARSNHSKLTHQNTPQLLLSFCQQVCLGMTFLSSKGFVHRDLAARNILVSADNVCKIIDFGLSRDLEDENYYVSHNGAIIPVKWTAPEALNYRKYSTASDVWSYGCLMYEIWSIGHKPYEDDSNMTALEKICSYERLPAPPGCPEAIYSLMISCWHPVADERPSFHDVMVSLLQPNQTILKIPESALSSHPQAGTIGGSLNAGKNMYPALQHAYTDAMDNN